MVNERRRVQPAWGVLIERGRFTMRSTSSRLKIMALSLLVLAPLVVAAVVPPRTLHAQVRPGAQEPPKAVPKAPATPNARAVGETCSVSPTGTVLAGRPDETQAAGTNRWTKRQLNVVFLDGADAWNQSVR